jgi:hypothetical protein
MTRHWHGSGRVLAIALICLVGMSARLVPLAADAPEGDSAPRHTARSPRLTVFTDLTADQADDLLRRMELTLDKAVTHWERPVRERIECYVIDNLDDWPDSALPHPVARMIVGNVGGAAFGRRVGVGIQARNEVKVLASTDPDIAEHEVVHAYCGQVFGTTGPWWYREGMAQMITFGYDDQLGLRCPPEVWEQIFGRERQSIAGIVGGGESAERLTLALEDKIAHQDAATRPWQDFVSLGEWNDNDTQTLRQMEPFYAWSWLLCHMLHHNPNYREQFKALGQDYLARRQDTFSHRFNPTFDQLMFEYQFMLDRLGQGYRVDLCRWDWKKRFRCIDRARTISVRVQAARGYQATGLQVAGGRHYRYEATGQWRTGPNRVAVGADGDDQGLGGLEAVVLNNYQLSAPFVLGQSGSFTALMDGQVYVRCRADWTRLSDNEGSVVVTFSRPRRS